jgi:hypothetical protein
MRQNKSLLGGQIITRKQALEGLGNPKTWVKDATELQLQFEKKPVQKISAAKRVQTLLERARELGRAVSGFIGEPAQPKPMFAKASAKKKMLKRRTTSAFRKKSSHSKKPRRKNRR